MLYRRNDHLKKPETVGEPFCTHAQYIRYFDADNNWVADVFQYLRRDGTIGASGRPDPKRLRLGGQITLVALP